MGSRRHTWAPRRPCGAPGAPRAPGARVWRQAPVCGARRPCLVPSALVGRQAPVWGARRPCGNITFVVNEYNGTFQKGTSTKEKPYGSHCRG
ncbi:hypothetical protein TIFTF001_055853 [Ficus carica]|uniref:Uncharacterized protein n=1 Tax=Ficus carica TaxID=3494 RepID=A0AA88JBD5_FICCA|nr:hypothetical protein TIFTF001_055853 [Ficus carica]